MPPSVCRMGNKIYDMKQLQQLNLVNRTVNTNGDKVFFKQSVRWIRIHQFGSYQYKTSHSESDEWMTVNVLKQKCPSEVDSGSLRLSLRGVTQSAVKSAKIIDLKKQLPFIPKSAQDFYQQVIAEGTSSSVADDQESSAEDIHDGPSTLQEKVSCAYATTHTCFDWQMPELLCNISSFLLYHLSCCT